MTNAPGFLNIAHRGARAFAPENTVAAIRIARRTGANAVELDVQMSRDGELVVFHDDDLSRCSDAPHRFPEHTNYSLCVFTWEELSVLDVGTWYVHQLARQPSHRDPYLRDLAQDEVDRCILPDDADEYASGSVRIPRLRDALVVVRDHQLAVVLDLKTIPRRYPGIASKTLDLVRELGMQQYTMITSFDHELLSDIRRHDPTAPIGVLTTERLCRAREYLERLDADAYHPACSGDANLLRVAPLADDIDVRTIRELTDAGFLVNVWTENRPSHMKMLIEAGVTGIFTDYPNRLARALAELERPALVRPGMKRRTNVPTA